MSQSRRKKYRSYLEPKNDCILPYSTNRGTVNRRLTSTRPTSSGNASENRDRLSSNPVQKFVDDSYETYQDNSERDINDIHLQDQENVTENACTPSTRSCCSPDLRTTISSFDGSDLEDSVENSTHNIGEDEVIEDFVMPDIQIRLKLHEPLNKYLTTTKFDALLMILHFSMRHGLTGVAILDLIKMINVLLQECIVPESIFIFDKIFKSDIVPEFHFFCLNCFAYIGTKGQLSNSELLPNCSVCNAIIDFKSMRNENFFITIPLQAQIKRLLETSRVSAVLNYRDTRIASPGIISDIFDAEVYKTLSSNGGILSSANNFSISMNTDGAPVYKSRKNSAWPIQIYLNELPPTMRFDPENVLVCGLWFGSKEPNMNLFLKPFISNLMELASDGLRWKHSDGHIINSKIVLLNCCLDSVARPMVQGTKQFNGYYGCGYCLHPGVAVDGTHIRYPICETAEDRTDSGIRKDMMKAYRSDTAVRGVKKISPLIVLSHFNLVDGFVIDYMHNCLLGVSKLLTNLWLDSSSHNASYYIGRKISLIDKRLSEIQPPRCISRLPRPVSDRCHWKANEWRAFLLYYSIPCLTDILPDKYLKHFHLFVSAIYMLLKEKITSEDLNFSEIYINQFVNSFEALYGSMYMVFNVHLLTHLVKGVRLWGPLWTHSAFVFESGNGFLIKLVKGTTGIATQIIHKYLRFASAMDQVPHYNIHESVLDYCGDIMSYSCIKQAYKCDGVTVLGSEIIRDLEEEEVETFQRAEVQQTSLFCNRIIKNGVVYHSKTYTRPKKSNDCVVRLGNARYAVIEKICIQQCNNASAIYVLCREINVSNIVILMDVCQGARTKSHIKVCEPYPYGSLNLYHVDMISAKCLLIACADHVYISDFPNTYEKD